MKRVPVLVAQLAGLSLVTALALDRLLGRRRAVDRGLQRPARAAARGDRAGVHRRRRASRSSCATAATPSWPPSWSRRATPPRPTCSSPRTPRRCPPSSARACSPRSTRRPPTRSPRSTGPTSGLWTGFVARSTVLVYNTSMVDEADLPDSIMDLADPKYAGHDLVLAHRRRLPGDRGRGARPRGRGGDQRLAGRAQGQRHRRTTATTSSSSRSTPASRRSGSSTTTTGTATRPSRATTATTPSSTSSATRTPAPSCRISGAGVLKSSDHPDEAEKFVAFLTSEEGQQALADSYALEYPLNPAVTPGSAGQAVRGAPAADGRASATSTAQKVVDLMTAGGLPLSGSARGGAARPGPGPRPAGAAGRGDQPAPAGLRRRLRRPARPGRGGGLPAPAAGRRAALEHHPPAGRAVSLLSVRPRRRHAPGSWSAPTWPGATLWHGVLARAARRTRVRQRLRLGLHHARRAGVRRRRAGREPVLLPAGLPARRSPRCAASTPGSRTSRPRSGTGR